MEELMNRVGEVYEPFKVHFLRKPVRPLGPDEVLVKVRASAICGSDLHIARGLHPSAPLPVTIGHDVDSSAIMTDPLFRPVINVLICLKNSIASRFLLSPYLLATH